MVSTQRQLMHQVQPIEASALRRVCSLFVTGVAVITTGVGEYVTGTTVNSFTSVSLEPPLVLFCLHNQSRLIGTLRESGRFGVNFLTGQQESAAWAFAGRKTATFDGIAHHRNADGVPILDGALAFLACRIANEYPGGDHAIFLGEVTEVGIPRRRQPLIFFEGSFGVLEDESHGAHPILDG